MNRRERRRQVADLLWLLNNAAPDGHIDLGPVRRRWIHKRRRVIHDLRLEQDQLSRKA